MLDHRRPEEVAQFVAPIAALAGTAVATSSAVPAVDGAVTSRAPVPRSATEPRRRILKVTPRVRRDHRGLWKRRPEGQRFARSVDQRGHPIARSCPSAASAMALATRPEKPGPKRAGSPGALTTGIFLASRSRPENARFDNHGSPCSLEIPAGNTSGNHPSRTRRPMRLRSQR